LFSFFKKSPQLDTSGFSALRTDMHSHLLPGIDDGAATMEDSLALIRSMKAMGYQRLITTPHIYQEHYPNTPEIILGKLAEVKAAVIAEGIDMQLEAAAEYYLDDHFEEQLNNNNLLTFAGKKVLIEMSFFAPNPKLHHIIYTMRLKGYRPVLAHPERYLYYASDIEEFEKIQSYGCELQVNLLSLANYYGKSEKRLALKLLEADLVDYLGTDLHHYKHAEKLQSLSTERSFQQLMGRYSFRNHLL